jgi:hypothetical protein
MQAASPEALSFADVEVLFAEGEAAIRAAHRAGVPQSARIIAFSPSLLGYPRVEIADKHVTPDRIKALADRVSAFSEAVYDHLVADPAFRDVAIVCSRVVRAFEREYYTVLCVDAATFRQPFAYATYDIASHPWFDGPWRRLAGSLETCAGSIPVPADERPSTISGETENADFLTRLRFENWKSVAYRCLAMRARPAAWVQGDEYLQLGVNSTIKETVVDLARRCKRVRPLAMPRIEPAELDADALAALETFLDTESRRHLAGCLSEESIALANPALIAAAGDAIGRYRGAKRHWQATAEAAGGKLPAGLLLNHNIRPETQALCDFLHAHDRPVFGFQHGTGPEITSTHDSIRVEQDGAICSEFFVYSEAARRNTESNRFGNCRGTVVGLPRDIADLPKKNRRAEHDILYCTNRGFLGHLHRPVTLGITDLTAMRREDDFVEQVLAQVPHRVTVKTYPSFRYPDPHPSYERARRFANVEVFDRPVDMRYMLPVARVLITALGHSTVTWCVLTGKPVLFIDQRDQNPIRPEAVELFRDGLIYFSTDDDWMTQIRDYLQRPIEAIEEDYRARKPARDRLIAGFMGSADGKSGNRAAAAIIARSRAGHA